MNKLVLLALCLGFGAGCRDTPEATTLPDPPDGLSVAWAFDDCAPWDGAAVTIVLADSLASSPREASYPHAWVSLYRPSFDVAGRTYRWNADDKDTGGAMWCVAAGNCEAATEAVIRLRRSNGVSQGLSGVVDLVFPGGKSVTGGFRAVWMSHELLCG